MFKRPSYLAASLVVVVVLILLNLPDHAAMRLKLAIGGLFLPLFGLAGSTQNLAEQTGNTLAPRRVLLSELEQLRQENQRLKLSVLQGEAAFRENDRLRQALGWQKQNRWKMKLARVVGRDPANWWRTIQINLGSRDGVRENLPVCVAQGLVGRVGAVGYSRSQVVLVGDPNCHVAALIQDTRETGIIAPSATKLDPTVVDLTYLSRNMRPTPGQVVVTSGLGGIFPKGIQLGAVMDSRTAEYGLYTEARVKLFAPLTQLEEVWVMLP